jgi:MoaA/NifB/PqqE/SkfB family radical SAM enzyme
MLSSNLKFGEKFCPLPFVHFYTDVTKCRSVCCVSDEIVNEEKLKQIREDILNNQPVTACTFCYQKEEQKLISPRQRAIKNFLEHEDKIIQAVNHHKQERKIIPISYDLRYSNLCNLECQMCSPKLSSSIALRQGIPNEFLKSEIDIDINENATDIYLAGGEPFLIKSFSKLLDRVINKSCEIVINTNATILTDHLMLQLDKFTNVSFVISIDGYNTLNEKIRKNSKWNDITANIDILAKRYGGYRIFLVNTTVQKDNVNHLLELGTWIESMNITKWKLTILDSPQHHHYSHCENIIIPDELMQLPIIKTNIENVKVLTNIKYAQTS